MSEEIIKVLEYLGDKLGIAIDWTKANVMPYAEDLFKRYATLKITNAGITIFIGLVLCITAIVLAVKICKKYSIAKANKENNMFWIYDYGNIGTTDSGFVAIGLAATFAIASVILFGIGISELISWIIVPEVSLIKEISELSTTV